jgi:hypothetical protein
MVALPAPAPPRPERLFASSPAIRILAHLRRHALDRALSDGADPASCPLLAARARQLSGRRTRTGIAIGLERMAGSSDVPSRGRVHPAPGAVHANRRALLDLASILRRRDPLYVRGIAMLELMLSDGTGPAYTDRRGEGLARELDLARAALAG